MMQYSPLSSSSLDLIKEAPPPPFCRFSFFSPLGTVTEVVYWEPTQSDVDFSSTQPGYHFYWNANDWVSPGTASLGGIFHSSSCLYMLFYVCLMSVSLRLTLEVMQPQFCHRLERWMHNLMLWKKQRNQESHQIKTDRPWCVWILCVQIWMAQNIRGSHQIDKST